MPFEKHYDVAEPVTTPPCIHLRSKGMYVSGDRGGPRNPEEAGQEFCWCNLTQHILGPDNVDVDRPNCIPGRDCYKATY